MQRITIYQNEERFSSNHCPPGAFGSCRFISSVIRRLAFGPADPGPVGAGRFKGFFGMKIDGSDLGGGGLPGGLCGSLGALVGATEVDGSGAAEAVEGEATIPSIF